MRLRSILPVLALAACARPGTAPRPRGAPYDVVIGNGRIVDGTGNAWYYGDIGIRGSRIAIITGAGMLAQASTVERVDATGLVVSPGFMDIQGQSTGFLTQGDARIIGKVSQGVTTEILGEGSTPAPLNPHTLRVDPDDDPIRADLNHRFATEHGFDEWLTWMEHRHIGINVGSFVGAGTIRTYGMDMRQGAASAAALDSMRAAVRRAMEDGAFGIGSALIYPPGNFASTAELVELARAMAPYRGIYITHMRSEADLLLPAIDEAIRIGREGGVPVELYHLKAAGRRNWDKASLAVAKIDSARRAGLDIQANMYPYVAGATGLTSCLPPSASADGKLMDNLRDTLARARIRAEQLRNESSPTWEDLCSQATPEGVLISTLRKPENQQYVGKRLSAIAAMMKKDYLDAAMDLILSENGRVETTYFLMDEANVRMQLAQPWIKIGTDAGGPAPESVRGLVHPRSYGTYPRVVGYYVREGVLSLEEAVRKTTSAVATRLMIPDRGLLREGFFADVVLFDPNTLVDKATFEQPLQLSAGVIEVWVNGTPVWKGGQHTGALPGVALRGPGYHKR
ncbi:MAG: D-aminoacylase domain protein [Gemmatimonadetes bacterium]|nr:D-aminoacylase domain protein [Gemmatimonadota bacterium]